MKVFKHPLLTVLLGSCLTVTGAIAAVESPETRSDIPIASPMTPVAPTEIKSKMHRAVEKAYVPSAFGHFNPSSHFPTREELIKIYGKKEGARLFTALKERLFKYKAPTPMDHMGDYMRGHRRGTLEYIGSLKFAEASNESDPEAELRLARSKKLQRQQAADKAWATQRLKANDMTNIKEALRTLAAELVIRPEDIEIVESISPLNVVTLTARSPIANVRAEASKVYFKENFHVRRRETLDDQFGKDTRQGIFSSEISREFLDIGSQKKRSIDLLSVEIFNITNGRE